MQIPVRAVLLCLVLLLAAPVQGAITLSYPASDSVSSAGVKDIANCPGDAVAFATENGLSVFNGTWTIEHADRTLPVDGLLGDFLLAVEPDAEGRLWIGFSKGLQIRDGTGYTTILDQQLLKNLNINDLQHRGDEMWIATGNAGIHCCENGSWTWYKPYGAGGLDCYEVASICVDYRTGRLVAASRDEGVYILSPGGHAPQFEELTPAGTPLSRVEGVRSNPFGGIYLFNATVIGRIDPGRAFEPVVTVADLPRGITTFYDLAPLSDGGLLIGTDGGLVVRDDGGVRMHLTRKDGISHDIIRKVFEDNAGRWWFVTPVAVGCLTGAAPDAVIGIDAPAVAVVPGETIVDSPANCSGDLQDGAESPDALQDLIDGIVTFIRHILGELPFPMPPV